MPYSHHSHSGQFCPEHAKDMLEDVILAAISKQMHVLALTEHMPRGQQDLYPGENETLASLTEMHDRFFAEAERLREKYIGQIEILVGFEGDWIRDESFTLMQERLRKHRVDLFIGSVHHVHTIPIDYDRAMYEQAREKCGGEDGGIFGAYFDAQLEMLEAMKPPVVGHYDLIRLFSDDANLNWRESGNDVWQKILRNLRFVASYGGLMELNSAALRKGMTEPYPKVEICQAFREMSGKFTLSDDSHGVDQVALNYPRLLQAIEAAGIQDIHHLRRTEEADPGQPFSGIKIVSVPITSLKGHEVFKAR